MESRAYIKARKEGLRAYNAALSNHTDPYLPVLEESLPTLNQMDRLSLGIQAVPLRRVVGSVSRGRAYAFAHNFMPILEPSSEFAAKWGTLFESVEAEGLRDPAKMLEYMGYYYLIEGNKRVSVMKSLSAEYIEGDVTRVIPVKTEDPENIAYFEYCAFAKESGLPDLFFTPPRHPSAEVRGLHCPRPTAGEHAETLFGEPLRQQYDFTEHLVGAQQRMTAHHPDAVSWVVVLEEIVERHMDAMVVQGSCEQLFHILRLLAFGYEMAVGPRVVTVGETVLVAGNETIIQLRRIIKTAARHLEWDILEIFHHLCQISLFAYCKHIFRS